MALYHLPGRLRHVRKWSDTTQYDAGTMADPIRHVGDRGYARKGKIRGVPYTLFEEDLARSCRLIRYLNRQYKFIRLEEWSLRCYPVREKNPARGESALLRRRL